MRLVIISDTHGFLSRIAVPEGDVLIHAGDLSMGGTYAEVIDELAEIAKLPHPNKVVIAGNHDFAFQRDNMTLDGSPVDYCLEHNICYLQDNYKYIDGVMFYGSPWQPWFGGWAFNLPRGEALREKWRKIPENCEVVITHGPPTGYGSTTREGDEVGDNDLRDELFHRVKPQLHISGHIHEGYGNRYHPILPIRIVNASSVTREYLPTNPPIVIDF